MRTARITALVAALALALASLARASTPTACPQDSVRMGSGAIAVTTAAHFDSLTFALGRFTASYDLVAGTAQCDQISNVAETFLSLSDDFDIAGVAAGTPVALVARLDCVGRWEQGLTTYDCSIRHGMDVRSATSHYFPEPPAGVLNFEQFLDLPLTIVAGSPERIEIHLSATYPQATSPPREGQSGARSTLRFLNLPASAYVTSCQGFGTLATPARASTWGRLKTTYR